MKRKFTSTWGLIMILALLTGCQAEGTAVLPTLSPTASPTIPEIIPFLTVTPSPIPSPTQGSTTTAIPSPTPTPQSYTVVKSDDMSGIALRYGIPLEALLTANPTIDPGFLSVGVVLQIPYVAVTSTPGFSTPTPVIPSAITPDCYSMLDEGVWCYLLVTNPYETGLENLSGTVILSTGDDHNLLVQEAVPLFDHLPAGQRMPLAAYFPSPVDQPFAANAQLYSAIQMSESDSRYLPVVLQNVDTQISEDGLSASVQGEIVLDGTTPAVLVRVLGVAYDATGHVVGVRKIEMEGEMDGGSAQTFSMTVYSLGPKIDLVELLVEAKP